MKKFILILTIGMALFFGCKNANAYNGTHYSTFYNFCTYNNTCSDNRYRGQADDDFNGLTIYATSSFTLFNACEFNTLTGNFSQLSVSAVGSGLYGFSGFETNAYIPYVYHYLFFNYTGGCSQGVSPTGAINIDVIPRSYGDYEPHLFSNSLLDFPAITPTISISLSFPTSSYVGNDFIAWHTELQIPTSTDTYEACVDSNSSGFGTSVNSCQSFLGNTTNIQEVDVANQYAFSNFNTTTTVTSTAYLNDLTLGHYMIATSSAVTFVVLPTASGNATGTYTLPILATSSIAGPAGILMSTSTCSGWTDAGCAIGNAFSNSINFLFGIDDATIQNIAGFQLANTQPWSFVPQIENDFLAAGASSTASFATSNITFNLGHGATNIPFFSATSVHAFISDSVAAFIRNLIFLFLVLEIGFLAYLEIKHLFGHPSQK